MLCQRRVGKPLKKANSTIALIHSALVVRHKYRGSTKHSSGPQNLSIIVDYLNTNQRAVGPGCNCSWLIGMRAHPTSQRSIRVYMYTCTDRQRESRA